VAVVVTGYCRLNNAHRSHARYLELGRRLVGLGLPTHVFYDGRPSDLLPTPKTVTKPASLADCWLATAAANCRPPPGTPAKDTTQYCVVQHQKSAWMAVAADDAKTVIWIDFGIFHLFGLRDAAIREMVAKVAANPPDRITIPGCWPMQGRPLINWQQPAWYVCGGVVVMPAALAGWFHDRCVDYATLQIEASGHATWEVNTWSAILRDHPDRFSVYAADHDEALFANYGGPPP